MDINFDFDINLSDYTIICLNPSRVLNEYKNTRYYGYQQKASVRHVIYNKRLEMLEKGKLISHLPSFYYRYELRLRDKNKVRQFLTCELKRKKILSEIVFLKEIPSIIKIQKITKCSKHRALQVLDVIAGKITLRCLDKRAKKSVTEIIQQINDIELSFDINTLTPYINVCNGEPLKENVLPNKLIGESIMKL